MEDTGGEALERCILDVWRIKPSELGRKICHR